MSMVNLISWVSRLADSKFSNWKLIPLKYLNVFGKIWLIFKMNIDVKKHKQFLNDIILPLLSIISLTKNIPLLIHSLKNNFFFQM
jgi:hypothetical protein